MSRITDYLEGLRAKADWLEQHESELTERYPWMTDVTCFPVDDRDELRAVLAMFGRVDRVEMDDEDDLGITPDIHFFMEFGGGVHVYAWGTCEALCDFVAETEQVTRKRYVPPRLLAVA